MSYKKESMLDFFLDSCSMSDCINSVYSRIFYSVHESFPLWLACFNPHSYVLSIRDGVFKQSLQDADWLIPDGSGIILASKILGLPIHQRITGPDFFVKFSEKLNNSVNCRVFFMGGSDQTLGLITEKFCKDFPNIVIAGTYSPSYTNFFSKNELDVMINNINRSNSDVLWIGLGAPKQEKWIFQNIEKLNVKFVGAIGAAFDFYSGHVKRSPLFFRRLGLEWLIRLVLDPRRLWKRTFCSAPIFILHVLRCRFKSLI